MVWGLFPVESLSGTIPLLLQLLRITYFAIFTSVNFLLGHVTGEEKYYIITKGSFKVGRKGLFFLQLTFVSSQCFVILHCVYFFVPCNLGCDIIINKDKGVSRIHAELLVDEMISLQNKSSTVSSKVRIRDASKYGTFVNRSNNIKEKVNEFPNKEMFLKDGDLVSFGTGNATYRYFSIFPFLAAA